MIANAPAQDAARWRLLALATLLLVALVTAWTTLPPRYPGGFSDAVEYLLMADRQAAFAWGRWTGDLAGAEDYFRRTRLPPLHPALIALVGGGARSTQAAVALTGILLVLAAWALYRWYVRELGARDAALLLPAAVVNFGFLTLPVEPVSEPLFMLMSAGALALCAQREPGVRALFGAALLISLLPLARMVGIAFVVAFAAWLALQPRLPRSERIAAVLVACAPTIAWVLFRRASGAQSYAGAVSLESLRTEFGSLGAWLFGQPWRFVEAFASAYAPSPGPVVLALFAIFGVLAVVGWGFRLRERRYDAYAALATLGLLYIWPFTEELARLALPVLALALVAVVTGAQRLARARARIAPWVVPALALVVLASGGAALARFAVRAAAPVADALAPFKRDGVYLTSPTEAKALETLEIRVGTHALTRALPGVLRPGDCVYSINPYHTWLYSRVPVVRLPYELDFDGDLAAVLTRCRYIFASAARSSQHDYSGAEIYAALGARASIVATAYLNERDAGRTDRAVAAVLLRVDAPAAPGSP